MPKYNPLPKVKSLKFSKRMENANLQMLFDSIRNLEQRVGALQLENNNLLQQQQQLQQRIAPPAENRRADDFFRIPDPVKNIPSFDGNKKQLASWLATARKTLNLFRNLVSEEVMTLYEQSIINKIDGRARDTICVNGNPTTFEQVAEILESVYGDKSDIAMYQTQLWSLKMNDNIHFHYKKAKEILQNMKGLAKKEEIYERHWEGINHFLEKECLAAFINGLNKHYFGHAQAAQLSDIETAYAFLCKFQNAENTRKTTDSPYSNKQISKNSFKNNSEQYKQNSPKQQDNPPHASGSQRFKPQSDRHKITPMEVDQSLRSRQNKIYNHDAHSEEENVTSSDDSDNEIEESNFQVDVTDDTLK